MKNDTLTYWKVRIYSGETEKPMGNFIGPVLEEHTLAIEYEDVKTLAQCPEYISGFRAADYASKFFGYKPCTVAFIQQGSPIGISGHIEMASFN